MTTYHSLIFLLTEVIKALSPWRFFVCLHMSLPLSQLPPKQGQRPSVLEIWQGEVSSHFTEKPFYILSLLGSLNFLPDDLIKGFKKKKKSKSDIEEHSIYREQYFTLRVVQR